MNEIVRAALVYALANIDDLNEAMGLEITEQQVKELIDVQG